MLSFATHLVVYNACCESNDRHINRVISFNLGSLLQNRWRRRRYLTLKTSSITCPTEIS